MTQPHCQQMTDQPEPQPQSSQTGEQAGANYAPPKPNTGGGKPADALSFSLRPETVEDEPEDPTSGHPKPQDTLGASAHNGETKPAPCAPEKPNTGQGKAGDTLSFKP